MNRGLQICLTALAPVFLLNSVAAAPHAHIPMPKIIQSEQAVKADAELADAISLVEGTNADMLFPEYWKADDALLMTAEEIRAVNDANAPKIYYTDAEGKSAALFTNEAEGPIDGSVLESILSAFGLPQYGGTFDQNGALVEQEILDGWGQNRNQENIPAQIEPQYAVLIERAILRKVPTDAAFYDEPGDYYYNSNVNAEGELGDGVILLHTSLDGKWAFVLNGSFGGWVRLDELALCHDRAQWEAVREPERYLTVIGEKVVLDPIPGCGSEQPTILYMGTRLPLAEDAPEEVNGRNAYGAYVALLPTRDGEGYLEQKPIAVAVSEEVTIGSLPLTSRNIVRQAYRFLGQIYGWGGSFASNDCSGMVRQIMKCFGLMLPRNSGAIAQTAGLETVRFDGMTAEERLAVLKDCPVGSILQFPGHIMLYLGTENGVAYCISSVGLFVLPSLQTGGETTITTVNCVCVNSLDILRANGRSWLENLAVCLTPRKS